MTKLEIQKYDVADHLRTVEEMALYLNACIAEADGDISFITKALGDIARAQGMSNIAERTGLGRQNLYKALSEDGNPSFDTILKVTKALGITLNARPAA
ncbi:MAG: putative addiction module antidote protein [Nitrosospira sp.]|nr:putative addiction module antidote protein [Nitrosospira sp.]